MASLSTCHLGLWLANLVKSELLGDQIKRPLHLYDTWGLRIAQWFESGLVGLEGVISVNCNVI